MPRPASATGPDPVSGRKENHLYIITIFLIFFIDKNLSFRFGSEFLFIGYLWVSHLQHIWTVGLGGGEEWRDSVHALLPYLKPQERVEADIQLTDFTGPAGRWLTPLTFEFSLGSSKDP